MKLKLLLSLSAVVASALFVFPSNLTAQSSQSVTLAWNPSPGLDLAGYIVHYGTTSGVYQSLTNVGLKTSAIVDGLQPGQTYFFAVTAYDIFGVNSPPSNEVSYQVPAPLPLPVIALTSPSAGASYSVPAIINLAAAVTANGHVIARVQFYDGASLLGEDLSAPYSFTWTNASPGNHSLMARASYDSASAADSPAVNVLVTTLPAPWQTVGIGIGSGSASESNGVYLVQGAGTISSTSDKFRFVYQTLTGNGEINVRLKSVDQTGAAARAGVMIRGTLTANSKNAFIGISPEGTFRWQYRTKTGGNTSSSLSATGAPPNVWLRLSRTGNTLAGYKSIDGTNWTRVGFKNIAMDTNVYFGFAVASGSTNSLNTSAFVNVSAVP